MIHNQTEYNNAIYMTENIERSWKCMRLGYMQLRSSNITEKERNS